MKMTSKNLLKKIIPMLLAVAATFVFAMPLKAMADPWCHHDHGRHLGWYKHHGDNDDWDDEDDDDYHPYYSNNYYYGAPAYEYGYRYGRQGRLMNEWDRAEAAHQRALMNGNRYGARVTSHRLYELDRRMGYDPRRGGYGSNNYGYDSQPYYGNSYGNSIVGPLLGNVLGGW